MRLTFKGTAYLPEYRGLHDGQMIHVPAGGTVEVSDEAGAVLVKDFPGIFVANETQGKAFEHPPVDRMIRKARTK